MGGTDDPETLATKCRLSGSLMFNNIAKSSSVARDPKALIACGVIPRSTAKEAFARIFWDESTSTARARINSSRTARVGMPRPWDFTRDSESSAPTV